MFKLMSLREARFSATVRAATVGIVGLLARAEAGGSTIPDGWLSEMTGYAAELMEGCNGHEAECPTGTVSTRQQAKDALVQQSELTGIGGDRNVSRVRVDGPEWDPAGGRRGLHMPTNDPQGEREGECESAG